jgi:glycosyltransferase involved in cell wall biosynthesis
MASTDGTREFCEAWLRPGDVYHRRETNTCPTLGFGEARTAAAALATCDWIFSTDADNVAWTNREGVRHELKRAKGDVLSIWTLEIHNRKKWGSHQIEAAILDAIKSGPVEKTLHRGFVRRGSGIDWKGYIHEEPYRGEVNCAVETIQTDLMRYHLSGWMHNELRLMRYYWMFNRALENPELQKYTNAWWYDVFCKEHLSEIKRLAAEYEKRPEFHAQAEASGA